MAHFTSARVGAGPLPCRRRPGDAALHPARGPERSAPLRWLALLVLAPWLAGCHAYAHAAWSDLDRGDQVRALLTPPQAEAIGEAVALDGRLLRGEVVEAGATELLLEVPVHTGVDGIRVESLHQRVRVPAAGVADLERRALHRGRTYAVIGAAAGVVGFVIWNQVRSRGRRGGEPPTGPPSENPRFGLRVRLGLP